MAKTLEEPDVGILCYVSSLPGFRGVLKQRYSDFIVREVDLDNKIVRLTSFDLPQEDIGKKEPETNPSLDRDFTDEIESFRSLAGDTDAQSLKALLEKIPTCEEDDPPSIVLSPDADKSHRAEVHNFFKNNLKFLVTDTVDGSEGCSKCVRVRFCPAGAGARGGRGKKRKITSGLPYDSRGSDYWPEDRGKFLRFNLYKENKDTQEALGVIGKMLGVQQRSFGFAGTKDKRAVSTQRATIFKQHAKKLADLNSRLIGISVGDFCYVREGLVLGQLFGNHFTITLRSVAADSEDTISFAVDGLGRNGFINYYGLQRFGSGSVPTYHIGAALLQGEWKRAVDLILDPREGERALVSDARKSFKENGDVDAALRLFPRYLVAERALLQCLKKLPGNYLQALKSIPRTLRMMYVHSYQSYLWNHAASTRVQKHGIAQVVLGDLVYCKDSPSLILSHVENADAEDNYSEQYNSGSPPEISDGIVSEDLQSVKVITSEDVLLGTYTFEDVVLPLPGSRIIYPENDVADVYHDMAKKDGISLTDSAHGAKEFSILNMKGGYRRVFQRPMNFTWEILTYQNCATPLAETDLDIMNKPKPSNMAEQAEITNHDTMNQVESLACDKEGSDDMHVTANVEHGNLTQPGLVPDAGADPSMTALKLEFTLPASCYATMAIRELLKASTSTAYQKAMN